MATQVSSLQPITPQTREVKDEETVENRLTGLIDKNSPYIQQARDNAAQQANRRGLINSSIAAGAGQKAAIESALPIAQQDAQTFYDQAKTNQSATNTFRQNEQAFGMNQSLKDQEQTHSLERMGAENEYKIGQMGEEQKQVLERMNVDQIYKEKNISLDQANRTAFAKLESDLAYNKDSSLEILRSQLKEIELDTQLNAEMKRVFTLEVSRIMDTTQTAIKEIGLSDTSPAQQANAVKQMLEQRDASINLLRELTLSTKTWTW